MSNNIGMLALMLQIFRRKVVGWRLRRIRVVLGGHLQQISRSTPPTWAPLLREVKASKGA